MNDAELLKQYVNRGSREALGQLAQRYVNLVYASARRQMGDVHVAEDVTQAVFLVLGRKAQSITHPSLLAGWLLRVTEFAVRNSRRLQARRQYHEQQAAAMRSETVESAGEPAWETYAPAVDEAMARLGEVDRSAVALRYLQGLSLQEVGEMMGLSEEAARKRVDRALAKLRNLMLKKTAVPSLAALAATLSVKGVEAAPTGLVQAVMTTGESIVPQVVRTAAAGGAEVLELCRDGRDLRTLYRTMVGSNGEASA